MAVTYEAFRQAEPPARAVRAARTVDRWGLVAGVTGVLGNVLLAVLFTTPADGLYAWTGPASDVIGIVSTLAITALVAMAVAELAYVLGVVPFAAEVDGTFAGLAGSVLLAASVPTPAHSLAHAITFGVGALISGPVYAAFPIWLIVLSYRLPGRAGSAGQLV
jgi:hypothetical protein